MTFIMLILNVRLKQLFYPTLIEFYYLAAFVALALVGAALGATTSCTGPFALGAAAFLAGAFTFSAAGLATTFFSAAGAFSASAGTLITQFST
jgi:hypothetical protein